MRASSARPSSLTSASRTMLCVLMATGAAGACGTEPSAGPPTGIQVSAGNAQVGRAGQLLPAPVAAKVTDAEGHGVPDVPVLFAVTLGNGEITPGATRTNGAGVITASWRMDTIAGQPQEAVAQLVDSLSGALVDTAVFTATVTAGPPTAASAAGGNGQTGAQGQRLSQPLRVLVRDAYRNPAAGATVTWVVASGDATLSSPTSTTDSLGIAADTLTLGQVEGTITVHASVATLSPVSFSAEIRLMTIRLADLPGSGYGIARTPTGRLVVSLIYNGAAQIIPAGGAGNQPSVTIGGTPVLVAVDAQGAYAYVSNMDGTLNVIDLGTNAKVADVAIPGTAHAVALSPRGNRLYVTNTDSSVFTVDVATRTIIDTTTVGAGPWGMAFWTTATDSLLYVSARNGASVSEIDMQTGTVLRTMSVGGRPHGLAIAPAGGTLYIADNADGAVKFLNLADGTIPTSVTLPGAFGIAITPDGNTLFVTTDDGYIAAIDVPTHAIVKRYPTLGQPRQILVVSPGDSALAADMGGWIDVMKR